MKPPAGKRRRPVPGFLRLSFAILGFSFFAFHLVAPAAASPRSAISEGNRLYEKGRYDEAIKHYEEAKTDLQKSPYIVYFNEAASYYKQKKYEDAVKAYDQALGSETIELDAKAQFGAGNALFRQAQRLEGGGDLQGALTNLRSSLDRYRQALQLLNRAKKAGEKLSDSRLEPDAKFNLELASRNIKRLLDKIKKEAEKQQQQKQDQKNQKQQQGDQKDKQEQKPPEKKQDGEKKEPETPQPSQAQAKQLDKKQAEQLLKDFEEKQKKRIPFVPVPQGYSPQMKEW